jgi:UDP-3-O-acyl-N-acetylglucosamine deacetylase
LNSRAYIKEISHAKTSFPFKITTKEKLIQVQERLKGAIIEGKNRNINIYSSKNISKTYYINEIARHKILDFLGERIFHILYTNSEYFFGKINIKSSNLMKLY